MGTERALLAVLLRDCTVLEVGYKTKVGDDVIVLERLFVFE